ncbi:MAG: hypothetical protein JO299_07300 [Gammaproteobacteria bacterium]|nr:hypothetical protein [Gammaproteobacteria bacterium]
MSTKPRTMARRALAALIPLAFGAIAVNAANLGFLGKSPISYFQQQDVALMKKNAYAALDSTDPASKQSWTNPKTGASGSVEVVGQFTASDGIPCKRLRVVNKIKNLEGQGTYTVCKYKDRGWILNADARPPAG